MASLGLLPSLLSLASLHGEGLSLVTFDLRLGPPTPIKMSSPITSISTDAISGATSSPYPSPSPAATASIPSSGSDFSMPPLPFLSMAASTATAGAATLYTTPPSPTLSTAAIASTVDAATILSSPPSTLQSLIEATSSSFSPGSFPLSSTVAPAVTITPPPPPLPPSLSSVTVPTVFITLPPHSTLSTGVKSGIAVSTSLIVIILIVISVLAFLWRKKRSAETKRQNDVEAKAIWVTRTFMVQTEGKSSGSGSVRGFTKDGTIPAEWATVLSEDAKVTKQWTEVDVTRRLARWLKARNGVR